MQHTVTKLCIGISSNQFTDPTDSFGKVYRVFLKASSIIGVFLEILKTSLEGLVFKNQNL